MVWLPGMEKSQQLTEPNVTPANKEEAGHDINITWEEMVRITSLAVADELRRRSLDIYRRAAEYARARGILIADTKFEWGKFPGSEVILLYEILTPHNTPVWPRHQYRPGC